MIAASSQSRNGRGASGNTPCIADSQRNSRAMSCAVGGTGPNGGRRTTTSTSPTAHDMAREFRWLSAMHGVFPLAPRPYLLCEDAAIIGSVFYAMERRRGIVVRAEEPPPLAAPAARRRVSDAMIDTLA